MVMRIMLGVAAAAVAVTPAAGRRAAFHRARGPVRAVQLISMLESGATRDPADVPSDSNAPSPAPAASSPSAFAVHDLSRRWVEYQMRASLAAAPSTGSLAPMRQDDPFARQTTAVAPASGSILGMPSVSATAIPAWMLGRSAAPTGSLRYAPGCSTAPYRPSGFLGLGSEARRQSYYSMMSAIACQYGIPVGLFDAMIIRESRYDPSIVSPKNAFGLTQLMPATAAGLGVNRYDVEQNLRGGARYLRQQLDRFGQYHLALAAYNAGPGRVHGLVPAITETQGYVANILGDWARLSGLGARRPLPLQPVPRSATSASARGATMMVF